MIFVFFAIFLKPAFSRKRSDKPLSRSRKIVIAALFLILGFYGGFIQAGVGILTIALLSISTGYSLLRINGIKVFLVMIYTSFSLILFFIHGRINIPFGLSLAAGHVIGAYAASSLAVKKGDTISKAVLLIALAGMAAKITGIF